MTRLRSITRYLAALVCLGAALLLLAHTGMPQRIEISRGAPGSGAGLAIGLPAPQFELSSTSGETIALDSTAGAATIINFWASWCAPCRREMRELQQLQSQHPDSLRVLAINMGESADLVAAWQREIGISYDLLLDPTLAASQLYKVRGLPTTYLLDGRLVLRKVYYGPVSGRQLEDDLQRLARRV
ncbi:MAG: TlpA family protein disulfide reductase [Chloroflexi bacterium]|nr:TlpA family protein disulfide reductase [Chloroflexota bacterium]